MPGQGVRSCVSFTSQMVFYIEACESGSMMRHLPSDINGTWWSCWPLSQAGWAGCSVAQLVIDSADVKNRAVCISRGLGQPGAQKRG